MNAEHLMDSTDPVLERDKALVRAIESLETIKPTGPIERVQVWFSYTRASGRRVMLTSILTL